MSPMLIIDRQSKASSGFAYSFAVMNKMNLFENVTFFHKHQCIYFFPESMEF